MDRNGARARKASTSRSATSSLSVRTRRGHSACRSVPSASVVPSSHRPEFLKLRLGGQLKHAIVELAVGCLSGKARRLPSQAASRRTHSRASTGRATFAKELDSGHESIRRSSERRRAKRRRPAEPGWERECGRAATGPGRKPERLWITRRDRRIDQGRHAGTACRSRAAEPQERPLTLASALIAPPWRLGRRFTIAPHASRGPSAHLSPNVFVFAFRTRRVFTRFGATPRSCAPPRRRCLRCEPHPAHDPLQTPRRNEESGNARGPDQQQPAKASPPQRGAGANMRARHQWYPSPARTLPRKTQ